jgi:hypothetical protein
MKITDWAIIFIIFVVPFLWLNQLKVQDIREISALQIKYNSVLRAAVQDGVSALNINANQQYENGYSSLKFMNSDKELAISSLKRTLFSNFGVKDDPIGKRILMSYIPVIVVIEYDGYSTYAVNDLIDSEGEVIATHAFRPKKPYVYFDDAGNSISFTLDSHVTAYEALSQNWIQGFQHELSDRVNITLLKDNELFEQVRSSTIVRNIEEEIETIIYQHNEYATDIGVKYTFTLPVISKEDWNNTIQDVGMLIFLQGIPVGNQYYNNFAFAGGRMLKATPIVGGVDANSGHKYYYRQSEPLSDLTSLYTPNEIFTSRKEAVKQGYFEAD